MAIIDSERVENLYNATDYINNTNNWEDSTSVFRARAFHQAINKAQLSEQIESIIYVGCGSGGVLMQLSENYGHEIGRGLTKFDGIDLSNNAINVAR